MKVMEPCRKNSCAAEGSNEVCVLAGNGNISNPATQILISPESENEHDQSSGRKLLRNQGMKYSTASDSVSCVVRHQKSTSKKNPGVPRAPDGGWGWAVVVASMGISLVADGVSFSFGIIYIEFLRYFRASKSKTSVIGSIFMSVPLMAGPLASALVDRFGCRSMTILGGIVSASGFILSSFANSIEVICFTFGVLAGLGLALCYVTAVVSVTFWFEKKRSLANGLGVCGTGLGTFLFAPLTQFLIEEYGWRGTTLLLAGAFLQMCICGAVMREPSCGDSASQDSKDAGADACSSLLPETVGTASIAKSSYSTKSTVSKRGLTSQGGVTLSLVNLPAWNDENHVTTALNNLGSGLSLPSSVATIKDVNHSNSCIDFTNIGGVNEEPREKLVPTVETSGQIGSSGQTAAVEKKSIDASKEGISTNTISCPPQGSQQISPIMQLQGIRFRRNSITVRSGLQNYSYDPRVSSCPDIYKSCPKPFLGDRKEAWYLDFLQTVKGIMDFSMFLEWHFMLLNFSTFLLFTFFIVPYFYLAEHVIRWGYSESEASMLISIIGILNTIGMIVLGWAGDQPWMNVTKTYSLCLCLCGIFTGIMPLLTEHYSLLAISSALFGLFFASNFSFTPVLIVELTSLDRFTMAYGLILFTQGLGNLLGPPLAGWLYDITQTWNLSFYLAGFFIFLSGLAIAIIPCTNNFTLKCQAKKK
ncbi:hypothetical protein J437_LFUL001219, partial [Ladona fulva]